MLTFPIEFFEWKPHISVLRQTCKKLGIDEANLPGKIRIIGASGKFVSYQFMAKDGSVQAAYFADPASSITVPEAKGTYLYLEFE